MTAGRLADAARHLPTVNVRGKRCLDVATAGASFGALLQRGGAAAVDAVELSDRRAEALAEVGGEPYDVVVASVVLAGARVPLDVAEQLHRLTRGVLLSVEPIDVWTSLLARGRPLFGLEAQGRAAFNGAGQRQLLELAGFAIERASAPFAAGAPAAGRLSRLAVRAIAREDGTLHRALLARPVRSAQAARR